MAQLHKRIDRETAKTLFESYLAKEISCSEIREILSLGKTRFFELIAGYRKDPINFTLEYRRKAPTNKLDTKLEKLIEKELKQEQKLIANKETTVWDYNYSFVRDTIKEKHGRNVSVTTIISRAKELGFYRKKKPRKVHDRLVLTTFVGELCQHDSSHHLFSPYMQKKLYLITTLDDHSRLILFADLFEAETTWNHISSLKSVFLQYGCPLKYYTDQHVTFRYVQGRDTHSIWRNFQKFTDDVDTQFKKVLDACNVKINYALSPQAKGKIERPYRWIQDRLVRIAAREKISNLDDLRKVLKELIQTYNHKWIHSTTKEIPIIRFENSLNDKRCLFKPLKLTGHQTLNDIFCFKTRRMVNPYRKITLEALEIPVPNGNPRDQVEICIAPEINLGFTELRFWQNDKFLGSQKIGLHDLKLVRF